MASDPILFTAELFTSIGVVLAAAIFGRLAIKSKNYGSFQFQVSIFILFWAASELPHIFGTTGLIDETSYTTIGLAFHFVSMAFFAIFVGAKSFQYFGSHAQAKSPKPSFPSTSVSPTKQSGGSD